MLTATEEHTEEHEIVIDSAGAIRMIYSDNIAELMELGEASIRRASHVEPVGTQWEADMSPMKGPVLGLFPTRAEALAAEVAWLREHM